MGSTIPPISISIIGGGISGLALAAGLAKKPHLDVRVYESVASHRDVGAGLALHKNALGAMSLISPDLRRAYQDKAIALGEDEDVEMATEVILAQGPHTGKLVAELGRARGRKSVSRADLLDGFRGCVPRDVVRFGKRLARIVEGDLGGRSGITEEEGDGRGEGGMQCSGYPKIKLVFEDGETVETDCVLGADGIHSVVRSHLLGADHPATKPKNHDRWQVFRTLVSTEEALTVHGVNPRWKTTVPIMTGPLGHINVIPLNKGTRLSVGVAVRGIATPSSSSSAGPSTAASRPMTSSVSQATTTFSNGGSNNNSNPNDQSQPQEKLDITPYQTLSYHPEALSLLALICHPSTPLISWSVGDHDHAPFYARNRVAMLGDAAHASLPFAGNGAAQALEDAAVLDHLFSHVWRVSQVAPALRAYDLVRRGRSQGVVELARKFGRVYAHCEDIDGDGDEDGDGREGWEGDGQGGGKKEPSIQNPDKLRAFFVEAGVYTNEFDLKKQNDEAMEVYEGMIRGRSRSCGHGQESLGVAGCGRG